jgi:preprotein translocase subunit YajC
VPVPSSVLAASTAKGSSGGSGFILVVLFGLVLFFLFRRSQRNARNRAAGVPGIVVGSRVITTSGIYATVVAVDDATYDLEVDDDVIIKFAKAAVTRLAPDVDAEEAGSEDTAEHDHGSDADHDHDDAAAPSVLLDKPQREDPARSSSES